MAKTRIHFHSDCYFFAGCEIMLIAFFNHKEFMQSYDVSFSYRYNPEYEEGFKNRVKTEFNAMPLVLFDLINVYNTVSKLNIVLRMPIYLVMKLLFARYIFKYIFILANMAKLYKTFKTEKIEILYINNGGYPGAYSCTSAVLAAKLAGIDNIIYALNNVALPYNNLERITDLPFDYFVKRFVKIFMTGSRYAAQALKKVLDLQDNKVMSIANGIIPREVTESRSNYLKKIGITESLFVIGIIAVLEERKGHIYLLKALERMKREGKVLPLILIEGNGPQREFLKNYVASAALENNVVFIDKEKNIYNLMNAIDAMALTSTYGEDFPNVILEAMSLGKPVIASDFGGINEQIENNHDGILIKVKDIESIAKAIERLMSDSSLREKLSENARQKYTKHYSAQAAVNNRINIFKSMEGKSL